MSIQAKIKSYVNKCDYKGVQWYSNEPLLGGIKGVDLAFQKNPNNNMIVGLENLHCSIANNIAQSNITQPNTIEPNITPTITQEHQKMITELVQNITMDTVSRLLQTKSPKERLYELVPCDKLMRLFVPLKLSKISDEVENDKHEKDVIDIMVKLFDSAYDTVFQDNIKFDRKKCKLRRLDDDHIIIITPHIVTWQIIQFFWNNLLDILHSTVNTKDRILYNKLFYYTLVTETNEEIDIDTESTFKTVFIKSEQTKLYFQNHCIFDEKFVAKFCKKSNQAMYLKLPILVPKKYESNISVYKKDEASDQTWYVSCKKEIDKNKLKIRDIILQFHRPNNKNNNKILCKDVFTSINQVLKKNNIGLEGKWYGQKLKSFLDSGIIELSVGNYCILTHSTNFKTHHGAKLCFEISLDGALYARCSQCPNRISQIVWEKNSKLRHNPHENMDPKNIRWNLFQDDYDFPDAIVDDEDIISKEVAAYIGEEESRIDYIEEELSKNDRGLSTVLCNFFKRRVKVVDRNGAVFLWNGKMWEEDESKKFHKIISIYSHYVLSHIIEQITQQIESARREALIAEEAQDENAAKTNKYLQKGLEGKKKKYDSFRDKLDKGITRAVQDFLCCNLFDNTFLTNVNKHPYYFAAKNGMVNLKTNCLEGFHPNFYLTCASNYKFESCSCPAGECTMDKNCDSKCDMTFIHNTFRQIMAYDTDLYDHFRWVLGYALVGDPKKKKLLIGQGPKNNAKSLVASIIGEVLPMYVKVMSKSVVVDYAKSAENSHSSHLTHLNGTRLAVLSETGQYDRLNEDQVKNITGGGEEKKHVREAGAAKGFDMTLGFVPFIFTNFPPKLSLNDSALWERLCPVLFPVTFCDEPNPKKYPEEMKRNDDLNNILRQKTNLKKIFNWLVRCCVYYCQNQNKTFPDRIQNIVKDYSTKCNELAQFLDGKTNVYELDPNGKLPLDDLKSDFEDSCKRFTQARRQQILDHHYFDLMMKKMGLTIESHGNERYVVGIKSLHKSVFAQMGNTYESDSESDEQVNRPGVNEDGNIEENDVGDTNNLLNNNLLNNLDHNETKVI